MSSSRNRKLWLSDFSEVDDCHSRSDSETGGLAASSSASARSVSCYRDAEKDQRQRIDSRTSCSRPNWVVRQARNDILVLWLDSRYGTLWYLQPEATPIASVLKATKCIKIKQQKNDSTICYTSSIGWAGIITFSQSFSRRPNWSLQSTWRTDMSWSVTLIIVHKV